MARNRFGKFLYAASAAGGLIALIIAVAPALLASTEKFSVPDDVALRIRLDDTLTSQDSQVGDPFSATVVDESEYRHARVYGHVSQIDVSGRIKGHTSMMLRFDRLVMPDGRRALIHAEIVELYHAPSWTRAGSYSRRASRHGSRRRREWSEPARANGLQNRRDAFRIIHRL
jgi:hypothetical protein